MKTLRKYSLHLLVLFLAFGGCFMKTLHAAQGGGSIEQLQNPGGTTQPPLVQKVAVIAAFSLAPFAIMILTPFLKMVITLSLLRQALGVQNSPPNQVINGIALLMAIYVMFPVGLAMYKEAETYIDSQAPKGGEFLSDASAYYLIGILERTREPLRNFLKRNTSAKHRQYFNHLAQKKFPKPYSAEVKPTDFIVLIPAFITSEVKAAFEIGVLIYLPFFVIDLVVSNVLLAMGMMMLSPLTIALPLKLLLLVMIDGWTLLVEGVVLTYK